MKQKGGWGGQKDGKGNWMLEHKRGVVPGHATQRHLCSVCDSGVCMLARRGFLCGGCTQKPGVLQVHFRMYTLKKLVAKY